MTYEEALETKVTREQVIREIRKHPGINPDEFFAEYGEHQTYSGADVLGWLGY